MYVTDEEKKNVAKNVLWLRKQYGLSQKEMAKRLSISPKSLSRIERGDLPVRLCVLVPFRISCQFEIPARMLFSAAIEEIADKK
jgi:transcriptional regulator with XRE-family HTH domain